MLRFGVRSESGDYMRELWVYVRELWSPLCRYFDPYGGRFFSPPCTEITIDSGFQVVIRFWSLKKMKIPFYFKKNRPRTFSRTWWRIFLQTSENQQFWICVVQYSICSPWDLSVGVRDVYISCTCVYTPRLSFKFVPLPGVLLKFTTPIPTRRWVLPVNRLLPI